MHDTLRMHVIAGAEQLPHVVSSVPLIKDLVFLFCNFLKKLAATYVLHDQIDVFLVNVSLVVLDNIWVVQLGEYVDFLLDRLEMIFQLGLIHNFNGNFMLPVVLVKREEHFPKCS